MNTANVNSTVPAHVPPELVYDFDIWKMPAEFSTPIDYFKTIQTRSAPPIFYTPRNGGHWVLHKYHDTLEGYRDTDLFTNFPNGIPARQGAPERLIPVEIDPPEHQKYRSVLFPAFSPAAVRRLERMVRGLVIELIEGFRMQGRCDFAQDLSFKLPTTIFVNLLGMPLEQLPQILKMEHEFLRGTSEQAREQGANAIFGYIVEFIRRQEAAGPGDGLVASMLNARDAEGRPWSKKEIYNATFLLYVAGLDTVANMMTYIWHHLATEAATRHQVAAEYSRVAEFVDELMRIGVPAVNARRVRHDGVFRGISMKKGDAVLCVPTLANRDPEFFPNPDQVDLQRSNARQHVGFGAGVHRCLGQHLARFEILVAIEEWFRRIPEFTLAPRAELEPYCGNINGLGSLPLVWQNETR